MAEATQLDRIEAALANLIRIATETRANGRTTLAQELTMSNVLDTVTDQVTSLTTLVAAEGTVEQSAITLLNGLSGQITALGQQLATAIANAADPAAVSAIAAQLGALGSTIQTNTAALAAAVTANTPTAPASAR